MAFLDENGLSHLWLKITNKITSMLPGVFKGATSSSAGSTGIVPAPPAGAATRYLRNDGTWAVPPDTNTTYTEATASKAGLMSAANFSKLAAFSAASEYAKKSDISSVYRYKGSVTNATALPTSGQVVGDTYDIKAASTYGPAGTNVAWNGSAWDALGGSLDLEAITNADIDEICV